MLLQRLVVCLGESMSLGWEVCAMWRCVLSVGNDALDCGLAGDVVKEFDWTPRSVLSSPVVICNWWEGDGDCGYELREPRVWCDSCVSCEACAACDRVMDWAHSVLFPWEC